MKLSASRVVTMQQQQQQCLQTPTPMKKKEKEASPWWDFFSHCKEDPDSSDSEHDELSYAHYCNDMIYTPGAANTADDDPKSKASAPLSPKSAVRTTPVKLISGTRSNNYVSGENNVATARPETPGTQDSSFETRSSSSSVPDHDDMRESSFQSVEKEEGEGEEEEECDFIGNIEVKSISPILPTQQRKIRQNAYDLLKQLGEEGSDVDLNSTFETEVEREEEEYNHATNDDDNVTSVGANKDDDDNNDDDNIMAELHTEIANLTNQLKAATRQSTQDASKIKSLEAQLQQALNKVNQYEETIDSVNEAVARSHLFNEEIVKELVVSRKENDDLTMRLLNHDKESKEKEEEEYNSKESPSLEGDTNTSPASVTCKGDATDEDSEASFVEGNVENDNDHATTATASSPMTCNQFPSVFHHRQQPLPALQDHLVSCIKLPLRVVSILFSVWVAIILLRIAFIFSVIVVDHNSLLEDDGFNTPCIY